MRQQPGKKRRVFASASADLQHLRRCREGIAQHFQNGTAVARTGFGGLPVIGHRGP
jgi:hypothetical protein